MERWIQVVVRVPRGGEEVAGDALVAPPFSGALLEPGAVTTYVLAELAGAELREEVLRRLAGVAVDGVEIAAFAAPDPEALLRERRPAFRIGRIAAVPPAHAGALRARDVPLVIEAGFAFGSGRHGTTRLALLGLQYLLAPGERVLDAGSGSGILSVAAALLGAREAVGFDIDVNARPAGEELARTNGVAERCRFVGAGFHDFAPAERGFDGLLANLHYDLLQRHAEDMAERLRPGGFFVWSGCRIAERERTAKSAESAGLAIEWQRARGKWWACAGRRARA